MNTFTILEICVSRSCCLYLNYINPSGYGAAAGVPSRQGAAPHGKPTNDISNKSSIKLHALKSLCCKGHGGAPNRNGATPNGGLKRVEVILLITCQVGC